MRVDPGKTNIWVSNDEDEEPVPVQGRAAIVLAFVVVFGFFIKILFI